MSQLLEKAAEKHQTRINIVNSFGCPKNNSEDIVQEMYIYLIKYEKEEKNIYQLIEKKKQMHGYIKHLQIKRKQLCLKHVKNYH